MSKPKILKCECGQAFSTTSALGMHIQAKHKGQPQKKVVTLKKSLLTRLFPFLYKGKR